MMIAPHNAKNQPGAEYQMGMRISKIAQLKHGYLMSIRIAYGIDKGIDKYKDHVTGEELPLPNMTDCTKYRS